ncbi:MAG: DUF2236 domain-containing protein [Alcanivoracaceae bacterium]|jgi:hypothetical protein|nr:DUF2236 domain-containing protein [Alcanivoracaceae bacterium]
MNAEVRPVPRRVRPFEGTQLRRTPFMKLMMGRDPSPTRDEYNEMVAALWQGDAPMDALLDWMYEIGPREGRKLYEQALERGIDSIADAPKPLRDFFRMIERTPSWVDHALIEDGVSFIHRTGLAGPYVLRDFALMGGYLLSGFNHALVMTGALNKGAAQRIAETGKWWVDCTEHDGLSRFGVGFKTTLRVRMVHGMVRRHLPTRPEWDNSEWGIPVNQTDMLATYLAFGPIMLVGMRAMGIPVTPHESKAVMHLWKYAAWLMGVEDKWLVDGERDGLVRLYQTFLTQSRADWTSAELGRALSEEPLQRQFSWGKYLPPLQEIRRKMFYHQHLSNSSLFLNRQQMRKLGLPDNVLPWFPLLTMAPRFASYSLQRFNPLLKRRLEREGRKVQLAALQSMWGDKQQDIINPGDRHPAHVG